MAQDCFQYQDSRAPHSGLDRRYQEPGIESHDTTNAGLQQIRRNEGSTAAEPFQHAKCAQEPDLADAKPGVFESEHAKSRLGAGVKQSGGGSGAGCGKISLAASDVFPPAAEDCYEVGHRILGGGPDLKGVFSGRKRTGLKRL